MKEGDLDRTGIIHLLMEIYEANWNFYTKRNCKKVKYKNNTGAPTVKGEGVEFDTVEEKAVVLHSANCHDCIGLWAEDGIEDGEEAYIIVSGSAQFRLKDGTLSGLDHWVKTSDVPGRFDATLAAPPLGGVAQLDEHMQEAGHCCEAKAADTDVLAEGTVHFN